MKWKQHTKLEKIVILISIFAFIAIVGLIIVSVSMIHTQPVCIKPECIHTASSILKKMKPEVEPCDDFYQFACGNFIETEPIPEDKGNTDTISTISNQVQEQLKNLISEQRSAADLKHFRLPNKFYEACMNTAMIEILGTEPIRRIAQSIGDWPVIKGDSWDIENKWTWQKTTKNFRHHGFSIGDVVNFSVGVDLKNTSKRMLVFSPSILGLYSKYLIKGFNETLVSAYYDYMVDIAVLFGADRKRALSELRESLQFEIHLAKISPSVEQYRDVNNLDNTLSILELQEKFPYIHWLDYVNALLPTGLNVNESEIINLSFPIFFKELGPLLAATPKRVIANYMMWRMHNSVVVFLPESFRKRQQQYQNILTGSEAQQSREKECVNFASEKLPLAVGSLYVRKNFNKESKAIASEMVKNIRAAFSTTLDENDWIDAQTKHEAQKKLQAMTTHIGYPDELLDNNKLAEYYQKLVIDEGKYFQSSVHINIFQTDYSFNKLRLPVNKTDWREFGQPAVVNAFYSSIDNSIKIFAGIIQGNFFNAQRPMYMNYGAIGHVMGHEMSHGFDDQGSQFNAQGNLFNWWQSDTRAAFLEKARCFIEQYGNYTERETGLKLNGINTQTENIADNIGLKHSYQAYKKWAEQNGPELKLPGLEYTPEQLFWISFGQNSCAKFRKEALKHAITTAVHAPNQFRVFGTLSNSKDFSKDFQCPEGSPMNPTHKCEIW